jgi:amino acid adenylation domain-containing protein
MSAGSGRASVADHLRDDLFELLLAEQFGEAGPARIARRPSDVPPPLSFAQRRLWFLDQTGLAGNSYNMPVNLRLRGELDREALERALREVVNRHDTLRSTFHAEQGEPRIVVGPPLARFPIEFEDLAGVADRDACLHTKTIEENDRIFELSREAPFRARLIGFDERDHALLATFHHIAFDGWSILNFARELAHCYNAFRNERQPELPPLAIDYADFAAWQRRTMAGEHREALLEYWRERLTDASPTAVPADYPRPAVERFRGGGVDFFIPEAVATKLETLAAEHGATPYMALLAVFCALLHRYTGESRVTVGSPIANRNRGEVEPLIGFFVNALVMSTAVDGTESFLDLLLRVKEEALEAFAHQDLPFEELVEDLRPERSLSRNPVFQIMFAVQQQDAMEPSFPLDRLDVRQVMLGRMTVRFDLEVHLWPSNGGVQGFLMYNTDLYAETTIRRLGEHLATLCAAVVESPARALRDLRILAEDEERRLRVDLNRTAGAYPLESLHRLFEMRALERPDAAAIVEGDRVVTYAQLDCAANRVAHVLRRRGAGPDVPVAISIGRSIELIVAVLGTLKAGGAYLPVDPSYPEARRKEMAAWAPVSLDRIDDPEIAAAPETAPHVDVSPDNLAYINFTSGSTGEPKAVGVPHRAAVRLLWNTNFIEIGQDDVFAHLSNVSFDAATFEIWGALTHGARLVIVSREIVLVPERMAMLLRSDRVTSMFLTTALFNRIIDEAPRAFARLRTLLFGGEAADPARIERCLELGAPENLFNVYGPTESTTFATGHRIPEVETGALSIPIGGPIGNTTTFVADSGGGLAPTGMPGELLIGGDGLARGYLGRPGVTAERFVPDPFGDRPGARLYRSGDRVRLLASGAIDFLGRFDRQVKIRGHRVEPGEVEARLVAQAGVCEAAVTVREDTPGEKRLVAYVVPETRSGAIQQVEAWSSLFDQKVYSDSNGIADPFFNTTGWVTSDTNEPIPLEHMRVWASDIVGRVLERKPESVMEIGCGTGMLLFQIAPHCRRYYGCDISQVSLDYVRGQIDTLPERFRSVTLQRKAAHDFADIEPASYDAIILSSIVQYFPGVDYLMDVIRGCLCALKPGGFLFFGDIRNYDLLDVFHRSIGRSAARETELTVSPHFFPALMNQFPQVASARVYLEAGRDHNELTRFRYHAIVGTAREPRAILQLIPARSLDEIERQIQARRPDEICFTGIPNARLAADGAVDPVDVEALAARLGYRVSLCWSAGDPSAFDAHFWRPERGERGLPPLCESSWLRPVEAYCNRPAHAAGSSQEFLRGLQQRINEQLPQYLRPSAYVLLDAMPQTSTGKVDRNALPAPHDVIQSPAVQGGARSPIEESLCGVFASLLDVGTVGVHDSFFDLGGHSLLATRLASQIRDTFGVEMPLQAIFESPTVAGLATHVERRLDAAAGDLAPLTPRPEMEMVPASFAQRRLWFLDRTRITGAAYNMPANLRIRGPLDRRALQDALNEIVARHESLRTAFHERDGEPFQVILSKVSLEVPVVAADRESERALVAEEGAAEFRLDTAPLLRARLLALAPDEHVLLLTFHHIVSDGWSMGVFLRELGQIYNAFLQHRPSPLALLPIQYPDFALWQRHQEGTPSWTRQLDYWKAQLRDLAPLRLPADRARPSTETFRGAGHYFDLPESLAGRLNHLNREHGVTMYMTLLAGILTLFHRYSGDARVAVGSPIANRNRGEVERLIGFFVNAMVLVGDFEGDPSFTELLARVRRAALQAFGNQDLPFEKLVEELAPERSLSRNPLIQVMFALQQQEVVEAEIAMEGLDVHPLEYGDLTVRFDMEFHLWHREDRLKGLLLYNTDLFDRATIERIAEQYAQLLEAAVESPQRPVSRLALLTVGERLRMLYEWSGGVSPYPRRPLTEIFEELVARTPDAVAIRDGNETWSYAALNRAANRVAHWLLTRDLGPRRLVGICSSRSAVMIAGILGTVKAGAGYVSIDPDMPDSRREAILRDADVRVVLPNDLGEFAAEQSDNPPPCGTAESVVYVCYTSGSTGAPKGIVVPQHAVARLVLATDYITIRPEDRIAHASNVAFDAATFEIWGALLNGASVVIAPRETVLDMAAYARFLREARIDILFTTTALFNRMVDADPQVFRGLRVLLTGGEAGDPQRMRRMLEQGPAHPLHVYGPTETTTFATWYPLRNLGQNAAAPPIGKPIANTTAYVLDAQLEPVPPPASGELCLGGDGLALGYLNLPGLTAEKFSPNPFGTPGERLYRTGDRVRLLTDGNIEFLSRLDRQIKLRGFRIEPAEIEARILEHPDVGDAAVNVVPDANGELQIVAYAVPRDSESTAADQVAAWENVFSEHVYQFDGAEADPLFNTAGWRNTRDGSPIPVSEMRAWAADIYEQVLASKPERVLEVGCGTGMLLFALAPHCARYHGADVSEASLNWVRDRIAERPGAYEHVTLSRRAADNLDGIEDDFYDAVILSSVVQYFPDIGYLQRVLSGLERKLRRGGRILLFDVRSLPLLPVFYEWLEEPRSVARETELALDPKFFAAWRQRQPRVAETQVRLQNSPHHNELTRFRYSAAIYLDEAPPRVAPESVDPGDLDTAFERGAPAVALQAVPNARLDARPEAIDPEALRQSAAARGYRAEFCWSPGDPRRFDAVFYRGPEARIAPFPLTEIDDGRPWDDYANNPLFAKVSARLTLDIRSFLKERVPDYMVPAHILVLPSFPLGPTGKVDRRALPAPAPDIAERRSLAAREPKDPTEAALCSIAAGLLGLESVDPDASFFDLGGHSLLATTLVSRIAKASGQTVPLRVVFERPTMAQLADWLERHEDRDDATRIVPVPRDAALPLSYAQERLWFIDRMGFQGGPYNTPVNLRLTGPLDLDRLSRALAALLERHEALRTVFRLEDGQPRQVVLPPYRPEIATHEIAPGDLDAGKRIVVAHNEPPFDLENGPVIRFGLLRAGEEHVLMISTHHIAFDGWSLRVLVRELAALYGGEELPALPVQYADYAVWQRAWLAGPRLEGQLDYWRRELDDLETLRLPTDHPRPKLETLRGEAHAFTLSASTVRSLRRFNRARQATTYMTLLAAFQSLLHRYSGQDGITVGTPIAGRNRVEIENLIGFFVNSLVMTTSFTGSPAFDEVVARVRAIALGAFTHQDVPFERLVEAIQPQRDLSRNPLFQTLFAVQQAVGDLRFEQNGLSFGLLEYGAVNVRFDLELHFWEEPDEIRGLFVYNSDLFEPATIAHMAGHLTALLDAALADPSTPIADLPLLSDEERADLLALSAGESAPEPAPSFLRRFEAIAAAAPDREALRFDSGAITYGALNRAANQWSRALAAGPETIVAIDLPRGPAAIVAMLAILKSGAAYLPIDPSLPESRRAFMLVDSGAMRVDWEQVRRDAKTRSDANPASSPHPDSLAYLLYTSGSTGTPKAVAMPHGLLNNLVDWHLGTHGAGPVRTLQFTPLTFDVSFQEILTTLGSGASLHLLAEGEQGDFAGLANQIERDRIERIFMPYTPLRYLLESAGARALSHLRQIVTAGEALRCDDSLREFFERRPHIRLYNHYGPTEAHVVTWHELPADPRLWTDPAPIGRPIHDVGILIADRSWQLLPRGATGELGIRGLTARGYHRRPGLTALSFVPDPAGQPGARMYRTGDLARWRPDGALDFFGRIDQQLKLRGFRIEPGEIESILESDPRVARAVVGLSGPARSVLAAWIEPADSASAGAQLTGQLRDLCAARLPAYMVPASFVFVDRMPLTSSGKVQHSALPEPEAAHVEPRPARTTRERTAIEAFAEILGTTRVGADDNFFELGGHSLLATRLAARLNVPVRQIFETPTPFGLARFCGADAPVRLPQCVIPVQPNGTRTPFFCVAPAGGSPLCYLQLAIAIADDRPFLGFQSPGLLDSLEPLRSVPEIAAFHITQMKQVQPDGPYLIGGWSFGGTVAYEMARQLNASGDRIALLALLDSGVGDPGQRFHWYNPVHIAVAFYYMAKFVVQLGLPKSWDDFRGLGQWVGVALPPTLREAMRPGRRWKFLRTFTAEVRNSLRIFSLNFRAGVAYKPSPIPQKATLFRVPWTFTAEDRMPAVLWEYCRGGLEFHAITGDHMSIMTKPHDVRILADRLRACLDGAEGSEL